jgi:xylan 1,4-beta-xylosidase
MRESWREDARATKSVTDFRYVRFHGIFDDENGVVSLDQQSRPVYNWSYVDQIYDGLLANGIRPFVELSFMPAALASSQKPHLFWYKPLPNPPRSYQQWGDLVGALTRHVEQRYGAAEVRQWYFEVWNEPNIDFWTGKPAQSTYFELYDAAARAIKQVDAAIRVGGPATAQAAWTGDLIRHCASQNVPLDFVSTHVYGNDTADNVLHTSEQIPRSEMVARAVRKVYDEVKASPRPSMPIIWSEYNASYMNEVDVTDAAFMGPWLANNIRLCDGMTAMMSYWTFSDVFEEQGVVKTPFYGGYGLIAAGGIPKAAYNDFALLHRLGRERLSPELKDALVTRREDGTLAVAVWNYAEPGAGKGVARTYDIELTAGHLVSLTVVDDDHGSALTAWRRMGQPAFPSEEQQDLLRQAGAMPRAEAANGSRMRLRLPPHALALIEAAP